MEIKIIDIIPAKLVADVGAIELFKYINNLEDEDIVINFAAIDYMTISFALEYCYQKNSCSKNITEKNLINEYKELMVLAQKTY